MDEKRTYKYQCPTCNSKLQKRGLTAAGTQRWYCPKCSVSSIRKRTDLSRSLLLERFVSWLLGKKSQEELTAVIKVTSRSWRSQIAWCWNIKPSPQQDSSPQSILVVDGIRVGNMVCLIVRSLEHVISWGWVPWENSDGWITLLDHIPAPQIVVCDGQKGILKAIAYCWPTTRIQRCHFHVWHNTKTRLTLHPTTLAGQELLALVKTIFRGISNQQDVIDWQTSLLLWKQTHGDFIKKRTYHSELVSHRRRWWYTHGRLRSAFRQLERLICLGQMFVYLDPNLMRVAGQPILRFTNHVEGGINSQLRTKLKLHRGMSKTHQRRLVDWYLYSRTDNPEPPRFFL